MSDADGWLPPEIEGLNLNRGPDAVPGQVLPKGRVSAPEWVDWHMIQDHEIDMLTQTQTGFVGNMGWCALGAVLGTMPALVTAFDRIPDKIALTDLVTGMVFSASLVTAIISAAVSRSQAKGAEGLPKKIRSRGDPRPLLGPQ